MLSKPCTVGDPVANFTKIQNIFEKIAPMKINHTGTQKAPRRNVARQRDNGEKQNLTSIMTSIKKN